MNNYLEHDTHRVDCAWCNKILVPGPEPISHGICESCRDKVLRELKETEAKKEMACHYAVSK